MAVLWIVLLLIVAGVFGGLGGVDAAETSTPVVRRGPDAPGHFAAARNDAVAPVLGGNEIDEAGSPSSADAFGTPTGGGGVGDGSGARPEERMSALEKGVELHHRGEFQHAAEVYLQMLEVRCSPDL